MKLLTKPVVLISCFIILMMAAACKKDNDKAAIAIGGFDITDAGGNDMGHYGPVDNDWTFKNSLSDREMALFDFPVNIDVSNMVEATISDNPVPVYPNPCVYDQRYEFTASDPVLLKLVVVNDKLNVLTTRAVKLVRGTLTINMDYSDSLQFPDRSSLRVYYSFSAQNKPNYKAGYGDIKICRSNSSRDFHSCFP